MKKEFKKTLELGMEITSHRIDKDDNHVFTFSFDRNVHLDETKPITSVEWYVCLVTDKYWFESEYPRLPGKYDVYGIDLFNDDDGNYILFTSLFDSEENFYKIIQEMCIEYCKEHKLPPCFMDTGEDDSLCHLSDHIINNEINKLSENDVIIEGNWYTEYSTHKIHYIITKNSIEFKNKLVNKKFNCGSNIDNKFVDDCCKEYVKKWNNEIQGKFDWSVEKKDV